MEGVEIRPITAEDIEGFHTALDSVSKEAAYLGYLEAPPLDSFRRQTLHAIHSGFPYLIAVRGAEIVGWCCIIPYSAATLHHHVGGLDMGVMKPFRSRGIGRTLLLRALEQAKLIHLERIELHVFLSNTAAVKLYETAGFVREGIKKKFVKFPDRYEDALMMGLLLPA